MDNIWHTRRPCTALTPIPHILRDSRRNSQHEPVVPGPDYALRSALSGYPTDPASSDQSTLPVWSAANAGQEMQYCIHSPITLGWLDFHLAGTKRVQDPEPTRFCFTNCVISLSLLDGNQAGVSNHVVAQELGDLFTLWAAARQLAPAGCCLAAHRKLAGVVSLCTPHCGRQTRVSCGFTA